MSTFREIAFQNYIPIRNIRHFLCLIMTFLGLVWCRPKQHYSFYEAAGGGRFTIIAVVNNIVLLLESLHESRPRPAQCRLICIINKRRSSHCTDYAALIGLLSLRQRDYCSVLITNVLLVCGHWSDIGSCRANSIQDRMGQGAQIRRRIDKMHSLASVSRHLITVYRPTGFCFPRCQN